MFGAFAHLHELADVLKGAVGAARFLLSEEARHVNGANIQNSHILTQNHTIFGQPLGNPLKSKRGQPGPTP